MKKKSGGTKKIWENSRFFEKKTKKNLGYKKNWENYRFFENSKKNQGAPKIPKRADYNVKWHLAETKHKEIPVKILKGFLL